MRYSVRFEEGYDLYDERFGSWLKINHPDVVSKTCTASSPHNTQISEAQQAPISPTQVISPLVSCESSSTQSVSQSLPLLKSIQTPVSSNGVSSTPAVAGPSSNSQDQSAPGSTPLTTAAAKRCSPLSDLLNLPANICKAGSKTPSKSKKLKRKQRKQQKERLPKLRRKQLGLKRVQLKQRPLLVKLPLAPSGTVQQTNGRHKRRLGVKSIKQFMRTSAVFALDPMMKT